MRFSTLVDMLSARAQGQPERIAFTYLPDGETEGPSLTFAELDLRARAIAGRLREYGSAGDRVLLVYPPGLDYIAAFFGCLYAGRVAVPMYPPRPNRGLLRLQTLCADAQAGLALTTSALRAKLAPEPRKAALPSSIQWLESDLVEPGAAGRWQCPEIDGDTLAFIQYTSGSTAVPKGVRVSHGNLLHNQSMIERGFHQTESSVIVSWLPLYHDMGLIGSVLHALYVGARCVLMSPVAFLQRPCRWPLAISRYRATTSGGPNFAYELCVRKINTEERAALDLSTWETAFNGSEPVRAETLEQFAAAFEPCGFRRQSFYPCYGLAEATLFVSGGRQGPLPLRRLFDARSLERNRADEPVSGGGGARALVGSGEVAPGQRLIIVDPTSCVECPPGQVGEIWLSGPSVAAGYWNNLQETERVFQAYVRDTGEGPFLRTGDLGFIRSGELFIAGRLKDLIIIRGRNIHPHDVELTVERSHPELVAGCGAAISVEVEEREELVIVQETMSRPDDAGAVIETIRRAVAEEHELQAHAILLIRRASIPKTTSGKLQRQSCRAAFLNGTLDVLASWCAQGAEAPSDLPSLDPGTTSESLGAWLKSEVAAVGGLRPSAVHAEQPVSAYGLDSLMAIELSFRIEKALGVKLAIADLMSGASINEIVRLLQGQIDISAGGLPGDARASADAEESVEYPLSYGQQALWFLHEMAPHSPAYHLAGAVRLSPGLDPLALRRAFRELIRRHPALRTDFHMRDGSLLQRVNDEVGDFFHIVDAVAMTGSAFEARLAAEAEAPFDLKQAPLIRVTIFERPSSEWVMLLVVHHIVADFWSLALLVRELGLLYGANDEAVASLPPPAPYRNYVRRQRDMLDGAEGERLWAYWRDRLSGELPALNLPFDFPRPPIQTFRGASLSLRLRSQLVERLQSLAHGHGTTLFVTLLAGFQTLLSRYTGQDDILTGSASAGRASADLANTVGYFVNPIVLRGDLSGGPTFAELVERLRQTVLGTFAHQDFPFALLVERLRPDRDPSRSPVFQAMLNLQKTPPGLDPETALFALGEADASVRLGELTATCLPLPQQMAQFDITLMAAESAGEMALSLQYSTDLFERDTVARMLKCLETLLEGAASDALLRLSQLPLLTAAETAQLLTAYNQTATDFPREQCLHTQFEEQAERSPDAVALIFEDSYLSYAELNARADHLADYLRSLAVGPEVRVGICLDRTLALVVGILAVLKAGGAYVPLDPAYPKDRLAFILDDSHASVLLTDERSASVFAPCRAEMVCLEAVATRADQWATRGQGSEAVADNLAYVIYTSGSTGKPKGVMISHRNVANFFAGMDRRLGLSPAMWLAMTSFSFDISVLELLWTLTRGHQVVIQGEESRQAESERRGDFTPAAQMKRHAATHLQCTPSLAKMLMSEPASRAALGGLQTLLLGGEALALALAQELAAEFRCDILNMYGPTETTIWSTTDQVERHPKRITLGRPIANTRVYILDRHLQPVPPGVAGELYIAGEGVARGYLGRPHLTVERFVPAPFGGTLGGRLYRTGDAARYLSDGRIEFLGRTDQQVKVRGHRIEPGEIEAALVAHPQIQEAAVTAVERLAGDKQLVAYLVTGGDEVSGSELRRFLSVQLPDYMLPSWFVTLDMLPLTPNGKLDRRALPAPAQIRPDLKQSFIPPRGALEEALATIWGEMLGLDSVGARDNFFELGGHSLLASQLVQRVRETFQVDLPLSSFFRTPTVADLALMMCAEPGRQRVERIAAILVAVAEYSDDEVDALLDNSDLSVSEGHAK